MVVVGGGGGRVMLGLVGGETAPLPPCGVPY